MNKSQESLRLLDVYRNKKGLYSTHLVLGSVKALLFQYLALLGFTIFTHTPFSEAVEEPFEPFCCRDAAILRVPY